jgi:ribulose-5-phosphate 4-epimerase/fuculose-1-phosphate aldolase
MSDLQTTVATACRILAQQGLAADVLGHVSVRLDADTILLRCRGPEDRGLLFTVADDVRVVDLDGHGDLDGGYAVPNEFHILTELFRARPDVEAVVHAHPPIATGFAVAGEAIPGNLWPELIFVVGPVPLVPFGRSGTPELGDRVVPYLEGNNALLLANHGAVTMGRTLDEAWIRMESLEHCAKIIVAARSIGTPQPLRLDG